VPSDRNEARLREADSLKNRGVMRFTAVSIGAAFAFVAAMNLLGSEPFLFQLSAGALALAVAVFFWRGLRAIRRSHYLRAAAYLDDDQAPTAEQELEFSSGWPGPGVPEEEIENLRAAIAGRLQNPQEPGADD